VDEQEPQETIAKWIKANTEHRQWYICPKCSYQAPRFRDEWVGLTDDEVDDVGCDFATLGGDIEGKNWFVFYLAIEAKLKEKNNG
jgi:hypothetical protein